MNWGPSDWAGLASCIAAVAAVIAAWRGAKTNQKVDLLEVKVDGRLSQLLAQTQYASRAEGVVAGRAETSVPEVVAAPLLVPPSAMAEADAKGAVVIGIPANPTPPMLLVPVNKEKEKEPRWLETLNCRECSTLTRCSPGSDGLKTHAQPSGPRKPPCLKAGSARSVGG
jgi:hypothetical protein